MMKQEQIKNRMLKKRLSKKSANDAYKKAIDYIVNNVEKGTILKVVVEKRSKGEREEFKEIKR